MKYRKIIPAMIAVSMLCGCEPNVPDSTTDVSYTATQNPGNITDSAAAPSESDRIDDTQNSTENGTAAPEISGNPGEIQQVSSMSFEEIDRLDNTKIGWGLGKDKNPEGQPLDAVNANEKYSGYDAMFLGNSGEKNIYLTFDEGYENGKTAEILDILKEKNVRAVFFVTYDYCKSSPELVQRMIDEGHTVGNHSFTHPSFPDCSLKETLEEVKMLHDYVAENFGYEMTLFRFPKGEFSERCLAAVQSMGYKSVFWSFAYADWDVNSQPSCSEAYEKITASTHPDAIYLLHAVSETNAACLADVIDYWTSSGYILAEIS